MSYLFTLMLYFCTTCLFWMAISNFFANKLVYLWLAKQILYFLSGRPHIIRIVSDIRRRGKWHQKWTYDTPQTGGGYF